MESGKNILDEPLSIQRMLPRVFLIFGPRLCAHFAHAKGSKMNKIKKIGGFNPVVIIATSIVVAVVAAIVFFNSTQSKAQYPETAQFLSAQFVNGQYLEGLSPGTTAYGFSLEAVAQLSASSELDISKAKEFLLGTEPTYLFSEETGEIIAGLAGTYLFASKVTRADNKAITDSVIKSVVKLVNSDGSLDTLSPSTFDYSWLILGLYSQDEKDLAATIASKLSSLARQDGGFGFDSSEITKTSSTDATAIAIMALELTKDLGARASENQSAIDSALAYLDSTMVDQSHFVAYDAVDVNGTAYALMAYIAATGQPNDAIQSFLASYVQSDGGIGSPWVENAGDRIATAQGYLALEGKSYLSLLGK